MVKISCVICNKDLTGEVSSTKCGHMFHYHCFNFYLSRSETCPYPGCEKRVNHNDIQKVYFDSPKEGYRNPSRTEDPEDEFQKKQNEIVKLLSEIKLANEENRIAREEFERETPHRRSTRRSGEEGSPSIVNESGTVIVCNQYQPKSFSFGLSLSMQPSTPNLPFMSYVPNTPSIKSTPSLRPIRPASNLSPLVIEEI